MYLKNSVNSGVNIMEVKKGGVVSKLLENVEIPKMFHARQNFEKDRIAKEDLEKVIWAEMSKEKFSSKIKPDMEIAITAGSRGIANVDIITKAVVDFVKNKGAKPFIVPAMGSHGGATAEGQIEVLESYGISEEKMGCEIRSSMETVELGISELGIPVVIDKNAYEADGIIVSCRLKPHNAFRGPIESGPCKMMTVGLGKQRGAERVHSEGMGEISKNIPAMAKVVIENAKILFAIPCIENAYDETCKIEAILPENILTREPELLELAFSKMPKLLVLETDVLVVDEIGKNYSGTGVDPNITGTFSTDFAKGGIKVQRTAFLNLSEASHGNSLGIGLASVITKKIFDLIDIEKMYPNCITSTVLASARIPCVVYDDKEAIQLCVKTCTGVKNEEIRVVRIKNSLHIGEVMLSESYYDDVVNGKYKGLIALDKPREVVFDECGNICKMMKFE